MRNRLLRAGVVAASIGLMGQSAFVVTPAMEASYRSKLASIEQSTWPCPSLDRDGQAAAALLTKYMDEDYCFSGAEMRTAALILARRESILARNEAALACYRRQDAVLAAPISGAGRTLGNYVAASCLKAAGGNLGPNSLRVCWRHLAAGVAPIYERITGLTAERRPVVSRHMRLDNDLRNGGEALNKIAMDEYYEDEDVAPEYHPCV